MTNKNSEAYFERAKKLIPGGVHSPVRAFKGVGGTPVFMERAKGSNICDVDGNSYIDYCMSWGPLILGHLDEEVFSEVQKVFSKGWTFGTAEPYSLELAEIITNEIPWVEKVRFVNSGTEAVMSALRVARAATGRNKIIKFEGCYHGHSDSLLVKAGSGLAEMACSDSAGVSANVAAETIAIPLNDIEQVKAAFQKHADQIAAVIIEPLPANNGLLAQTKEFLMSLREITRQNQSLLIFDEVISGFRASFGGMAEELGIEPDLVTYGKIIGGGFPVGAYGGKAEYMSQVAPEGPVYQAGTLSGNPIAMAAGTATLKKLLKDRPYTELTSELDRIGETIEKESQKLGRFAVNVVRHHSLFWMVFGNPEGKPLRSTTEIPNEQKEIFPTLFHKLLDEGIYLSPSSFEVGFLSTAHLPSENDIFIEKTLKALKEMNEKS